MSENCYHFKQVINFKRIFPTLLGTISFISTKVWSLCIFNTNPNYWIYASPVLPCWLIRIILGIFMGIIHISANYIYNKMADRIRKWCSFTVIHCKFNQIARLFCMKIIHFMFYKLFLPYVAFTTFNIFDFLRYVMFLARSL